MTDPRIERIARALAVLNVESDDNWQLYVQDAEAALKAIEPEYNALKECVVLSEKAFSDMFNHCLSNGVYNRWGRPMSCTSMNDAKAAAEQCVRAMYG